MPGFSIFRNLILDAVFGAGAKRGVTILFAFFHPILLTECIFHFNLAPEFMFVRGEIHGKY